jgi:beta-ribofuranosylaminobenzene 5'-phosphate synthase
LGEETIAVTVVVKAPARLHLGMLDLNGDLGRRFGSIGVAIQEPKVVVEATHAGAWQVEGVEQARTWRVIEQFCQHYPLPGAAHIRVQESIPSHVGLGSGTQLTLAIGTVLASLYGLQLPLREMARDLGRGIHSGIGVAVFQGGGFTVDGGRAAERGGVPPLLFQHPFPEEWFFVVAIPEPERQGVSGIDEAQAFQALPPAPAEIAGRICRLLVMKMLPALIEQQIADFGAAMTEIQRLVGDCFASQQVGGRFAIPLSGQVIDYMLQHGAYGAGQSSWGPAVYALVLGEQEAHRLAEDVRYFLRPHGKGIAFAAAVDNRGHMVYTK